MTKQEINTAAEQALTALQNLREINRMSAEDQEAIETAKAHLHDLLNA